MGFYKREMSIPTSEPSKLNASHIDEETELNYKNIYRFLFGGIIQGSWKETEHGSSNYYDFLKEFSVSFYLFNARAIGLTSEEFEKSTTILALIIGILGFVGNIVTICTILCHKKFHTPTFVAIGCLAFFDMLNIISAMLDKFSTLVTYLKIQHLVFDRAFGIAIGYFLRDILFSCSSSQIVFLYMIRYLLTVHPLQSKIRLTPSIVLACSVMICTFLSLFSAFRLIIITTIIKDPLHLYKIIRLISGIIYTLLGLLSICAIIIIHIKKEKALKISPITNNIHRKMNVTISIILSVFICFQISVLIYNSVFFAYKLHNDNNNISETFLLYTYYVALLFAFLNFSSNPYILFFASQIVS
ncbi:uncharacterized protein LOC134235768 [Saccostrea cucullata]|uniref:uncharacterized protein LOC134235768 n=1 Tax=Saccostrea cuccullata TaxID=36930 RepID=UPI002ED5692A